MLVQSCHQNQNELVQAEAGAPSSTITAANPPILTDNSPPGPTGRNPREIFTDDLTLTTRRNSASLNSSSDENFTKLSPPVASTSRGLTTGSDNSNQSYSLLSDSVNNNTPSATQAAPLLSSVPSTNANLRLSHRASASLPSTSQGPSTSRDFYKEITSENSILSEFDLVANIRNKGDADSPALSLKEEVQGAAAAVGLTHSQSVSQFKNIKMSDAYLSGVKQDMLKNSNLPMIMGRQGPTSAPNTPESLRRHLSRGGRGALVQDQMTSSLHAPSDKREKMEYNQMMRSLSEREGRPLSYHGRSGSVCYEHLPQGAQGTGGVNKRHIMSTGARSRKESVILNRRSMPGPYLENRYRDKFDVSDLDTNLPRIDLEAIETHLRQAREEERKRRSDREEIRRRLALESDEMGEKPRKHNLHSRLQSSMNLQICFMNETASDSESPNSDSEIKSQQQPASLPCVKAQPVEGIRNEGAGGVSSEDFFAQQSRLQAEARQALAQAKEIARLQMTQDRDKRVHSPITEMVRNSLEKVGVNLPPDRRRVSRQLLTEMNVAQLQVIVNDLHSHIEKLNENLVSMLLERDDLHMEQDSMLVDIEDLTRYLAAKYNSPHQSLPLISASQSILGKK